MDERQHASAGRAGSRDARGAGLRSQPAPEALQRILLTTDGTVVQLLEAWFDDPIELAGHEQFISPVQTTDGALEAAGYESILRRRVLLQGRRTGRNYVYADTAVVLDRLPPPVREALLSTSEPIGRILKAHRVETFKEVLRSGTRPVGPLAGEFGVDSADELLFRVYRIISGGRPIMLIAEHFPADPVPAYAPARGGSPERVVDLREEAEGSFPRRPCGTTSGR